LGDKERIRLLRHVAGMGEKRNLVGKTEGRLRHKGWIIKEE